jgi:membrane complex biogenesis BtpA family protein
MKQGEGNDMQLESIFIQKKPIIGMIHLRPLPGSPLYHRDGLSLEKITQTAVEESQRLEEAGVDGLQIENTWDYPYLKAEKVGHETSTAMAVIAAKVIDQVRLPIGINCHLNAGIQALAIANAVGAKWIRVFEWVNAYISHAGYIEGIGGSLSRYRQFIHADDVAFFCDVNVKHGSHFLISDRSIEEQARDAVSEGAEVLIVTGFKTGIAPNVKKVSEFRGNVSVPLFIGSGATKENITDLLSYSDGAIVGSYFKKDNDWKNAVDFSRTKQFMDIVKSFRKG